MFLRIYFRYLNLGVAPRDCEHDGLHIFGHTGIAEYLPAQLDHKDEMVPDVVGRMHLSVILHASVLALVGANYSGGSGIDGLPPVV